ncbi:MAG TPA: guanylate kinase [Acidimicrobiales bacterium]|nr:guanylate kinase [Acidimicrobiales bacterium]
MLFVVLGPGGVGKGTVVRRLVDADDRLWLSRSWTTRAQRAGEPDDAYVFVDEATFAAKAIADGFLETNQFAGNSCWYGTPWPDQPNRDVVLEIDLNGARQVRERYPDARLILVLPPDQEELERRLRGRGDDEEHVQRRLALADVEITGGLELADRVVINDDLDRAVEEVAGILDGYRSGS